MITFELDGDPVGWQRAGVRVVTPKHGPAFATIYKQAKTKSYERAIALVAKVAMRGKTPLLGPLALTVTAFMPVPKSWSIRKRDAALAGIVRPTVKPDFDNIGKGAADAVKGIVWIDDTQVVDGRVVKLYSERPRLHIEVRPLDVFGEESDQRPAINQGATA